VLFEAWNASGLSDVLKNALLNSSMAVSYELIVAILCLHRCQDPGSKLSATRWYETTSLPELTGIQPESFNNTRLHRALYALDQATMALMAKPPTLYQTHRSDSSALFLDVSDAWFCESGPSFAKNGLSKDGAVRKKIGIVLLCNRDGFPLRWQTVAGSSNDGGIMTDVLDEIKNFTWVKGVPLVCDRAMGRSSLIQKMHDKGIMFLTALARGEYVNYAGKLPISNVDVVGDGLTEELIAAAATAQIAKNNAREGSASLGF